MPGRVGVDPQWLRWVIRAILDMPQQQAQIVSSAGALPHHRELWSVTLELFVTSAADRHAWGGIWRGDGIGVRGRAAGAVRDHGADLRPAARRSLVRAYPRRGTETC